MYPSIFPDVHPEFPLTKIARSVVETSLPPSRAGNGRILMTPRLIESMAIIMKNIFHVIPTSTRLTNPAPIPIGHDTIAVASS